MANQTLLLLALCCLSAVVVGQITFSGNATKDFADITGERAITLLAVANTEPVAISDWMRDHGQFYSGWDLKTLYVQYDWRANVLYAAFDCWVICGDADGDGNPSVSSDKGNNYTLNKNQKFIDSHLQELYESTTMTIWTYPPDSYARNATEYDWSDYLPDIVVGDSVVNDLKTFDAYNFDSVGACEFYDLSNPEEYDLCIGAREAMYAAPGFHFGYPIPASSQIGLYGLRPVPKVSLYAFPNSSRPDIEFKMANFSNYGKFNFTPGYSDIRMAFSMALGSGADSAGEELQFPQTLIIPCIVRDACGECGGDNHTCADCAGVPNGPHHTDICGFCVLAGGDHIRDGCGNCTLPANAQHLDICGFCVSPGGDHIRDGCGNCTFPAFAQVLDICGFCVNPGEEHIRDGCGNCTFPEDAQVIDGCGHCVFEADKKIIDGCGHCVFEEDRQYRDDCGDCVFMVDWNHAKDACGDCRGNNSRCNDCAGIPSGPHRKDGCGNCTLPEDAQTIDSCKVCGGNNKDLDLCMVCFGDNLSCADCTGQPWGNHTYDDCDVCNGNNTECADCAGVPNGPHDFDGCGNCVTPDKYQDFDFCGVCGGHNESCSDCAGVPGIPIGPHVWDECRHCVLPADFHVIDGCGNCTLPQNWQDFDACNVCNGGNMSCTDCAGVVHGNSSIDDCGDCNLPENQGYYDDCDVCGGMNKDKDFCDVCFGDNSSCADCAGIPHGNNTYDLCDVCGGHNDCFCFIYTNITVNASDTWISLENRTSNYGKDVDLYVSSHKQRSLFRFDDLRFAINGATEQRPTILSAKLRLFIRGAVELPAQGWEKDQKISLHDLEHNFCEDKATWECRDFDETGCCVQWRMLALYPKVKADYAFEETASYNLVDGDKGWIEFDLKHDIQNWMEHSFLNSKSYLLKKSCETEWGWVKFWSCDSADHVNCPYLDIKLRSPCQPTPPVIPPVEKC